MEYFLKTQFFFDQLHVGNKIFGYVWLNKVHN